MALAFAGDGPVRLEGNCSSNIDRFMAMLGRLLREHGLEREQVPLCYEAGPCYCADGTADGVSPGVSAA